MNFLPSLTSWQFAAAGLVLAAGPLVIHLLNRRRYRTVHWAAMEFLRESMQRSRRILRLRDLLLLALRTLVVLLLGLALAQPYFSASQERFDGRTRLHAILLLDNSLSMGYQTLDGTLLDRARRRAADYVQTLPAGSLISVIPVCGGRFGMTSDPLSSKQQALSQLESVEVVDRDVSLVAAANLALEACQGAPDVARRIVLFSDQQRSNWRNVGDGEALRRLPSLQVVDVSLPLWENAWVDDLRVQDGLADVETPATVVASIRQAGPRVAARDVQVTLSVGQRQVASRTVRLEAGNSAREVAFQHVFDQQPVLPGQAIGVPISVSITPDALPQDDVRHRVVPVVASLPVVFVDQYGAEGENTLQRRLGETRALRQLLAPVTSRDEARQQLVRIRHRTIDQLDRDLLADARLVVIAGVPEPGEAVELLREYLLQGGQLVIAAGAEFEAEAWNRAAWREGAGILPAPLLPRPIGALPDQAPLAAAAGTPWQPFTLDFPSMRSQDVFLLAGNSEQELQDLYDEPLFFRAVAVDWSPEMLEALETSERRRLRDDWQLWQQLAQRQASLTGPTAGDSRLAGPNSNGPNSNGPGSNGPGSDDSHLDHSLQQQLRKLQPQWLLWSSPADDSLLVPDLTPPGDAAAAAAGEPPTTARDRWVEERLRAERPRVLARYRLEQRPPFLVQRQVGRGQVVFVSTGLLSPWNTLPRTNAFVLLDRLLRERIHATLPDWNQATAERIPVQVPAGESGRIAGLTRPGSQGIEYLELGFLGARRRGVLIENAYDRGLYVVRVEQESRAGEEVGPAWETTLSVAGVAGESDLTPISEADFAERIRGDQVQWIGAGEPISLAGTQVRGRNLWRWALLAVLLLLLAEMALLGWTTKATESAPQLASPLGELRR